MPAPTTREISGWVFETQVIRLLRHLSGFIGYSYDWFDEQALTGALDKTDDETSHLWYQYPLAGSPPLTVSLARSVGTAVVMVKVSGEIDEVLAARVDTLLSVLSETGPDR
jgi:hypothetical protein